MADITIPGVSDKYGTTSLIEQLMEVERVPLTREQERLDTYKAEQDAWRSVNKAMSSLRESVRTLYSFDNPFNTKLASSTEEDAITADPSRDADIGSFKIKVEQIAEADRFLSGEIDNNYEVPEGTYTFKVNEKEISFKWKGGKVSDFVTSLNRRGNNTIKASLIGVSSSKKSLLIESLLTGKENALIFEDDAFSFAQNIDMIREKKGEEKILASTKNDLEQLSGYALTSVRVENDLITVPPKSGFYVEIPRSIKDDKNQQINFSVRLEGQEEATTQVEKEKFPILPSAAMVQFKDAIVFNIESELGYTPETKVTKIEPVEDFSLVFLQTENEEIPLGKVDETGLETEFKINLSDYADKIENIVVKNNNTGKTAYITFPKSTNPNVAKGFEPSNPISVAQDAKLKYEGITMYRSTNKIDDIVENVTLNLEAPTEKTATIKIEPDTETSKEAIIELVGYYNQLIAEINILTQNKPELISELDYLSSEEVEAYEEKLGMFSSDSTLTSSKSSLQRIMTNTYPIEGSTIRLLSQIGISSNATGSTGYDASKLRGYFEIDEDKLDEALENNIGDIKNLFGYDSDGDLIIDTGIAYLMEKNLQAYVQTGGILATKTRTLDTKISNSEKTIDRLETQLATKEQEYKTKFGNMESTLSNLESQSDSITNFNNQQSKNR